MITDKNELLEHVYSNDNNNPVNRNYMLPRAEKDYDLSEKNPFLKSEYYQVFHFLIPIVCKRCCN